MSQIFEEPSEVSTDIGFDSEFFCPVSGCQNEISLSELDSFSCPQCGSPFVIKMIEDVVIPSTRRRGIDGYLEVVEMPELPSQREDRFVEDHGLNGEQASKITTSMERADFYEELSNEVSSDVAASFLADTLLGELKYRDMKIDYVDVPEVVGIVSDIESGDITRRSAVKVIREALDSGEDIDSVYSRKDISTTDDDELSKVIDDVLESETEAIQDYHDGEDDVINYLVGQVMAETEGQAEASKAREQILDQIKKSEP